MEKLKRILLYPVYLILVSVHNNTVDNRFMIIKATPFKEFINPLTK